MRCLLIDTSSFFINVAIIQDDNVLFNYNEKIQKDMSSKIMPIIKKGFDSVSFEISDIDKIFVVNGPGSFTGLRVGVTVAKTIAWSLKIDLIPISSLEVIASTPSDKKYRVGIIDARRGNVFAGIYDNDLNIIKNDQFISYDKLKEELTDDYEIFGLDDKNIKPNLIKIIQKHITDQSINPHLLKPNYLKLTEAEEKLNDNRSN